ncbi:and other transporter-domain-containing protein [Protomyces lactucae-debilis]|uniref:And other transporter-domain-containing protein n=1 Tax=Protomyces lactucae-debilis TaxID=2754530 RepID=A0A1Y2FNG4_PROLT|nr:and other transporter-domain-containing protein [Protomyces lactucae-debilis]ORY85498.1 and other transporter-domain-containing protein [Protomyces lactucae-debilis]
MVLKDLAIPRYLSLISLVRRLFPSTAAATMADKTQIAYVEDVASQKSVIIAGHAIDNDKNLVAGAMQATDREHTLTVRQALKAYKSAVLWCLLISASIVMEGYDTMLLGNFYAYPSFQRKYGTLQKDGSYEIPAPWQAGLSNGVAVGQIIGLFLSGFISEKYGYKKTIIAGHAAIIALIFIPFFAPSLEILLVGQILLGLPWGAFQTLTTTYAADVCPTQLRPYLTTYTNLCWVIGQFIGSGVLRGLLGMSEDAGNSMSYRIPFAIQWIWPVPILIGTIFAPESPYWLVRKGRFEDAKAVLRRLQAQNDPNFNADDTVAMMRHTNELEREIAAGTSYLDCFKGVDRRRTEIVCVVWAIQNACGSSFMGFSTYFYKQAGLATENAFSMTMAQYALGAIGTLLSWPLMNRVGRRTIYLYGLIVLCALLMVIGFTSLAGKGSGPSWAIGSMLLIYTGVYDLTVGPICYSLVSELQSTRLRGKTIVLARNLYNVVGIINGVTTPYMLNPSAWNWGAKSGFFYGGICLFCALYCFFRLPEPKGRTPGELAILFEQKVPARKFSKVKVSQFAGEDLTQEKTNLSA